MSPGDIVTFKPDAWEKLRVELGTDDPPPAGVQVIHVASERNSLRGYVYLGLPWGWQRREALIRKA